jgi:hypothetical protein
MRVGKIALPNFDWNNLLFEVLRVRDFATYKGIAPLDAGGYAHNQRIALGYGIFDLSAKVLRWVEVAQVPPRADPDPGQLGLQEGSDSYPVGTTIANYDPGHDLIV